MVGLIDSPPTQEIHERNLAIVGEMIGQQEPDHVFAVADAVVVLTRGGVPVCGSVDRVLTAGMLSQTYGVPVEILEIQQSGSRRRHAIPLL